MNTIHWPKAASVKYTEMKGDAYATTTYDILSLIDSLVLRTVNVFPNSVHVDVPTRSVSQSNFLPFGKDFLDKKTQLYDH